MSRLPTEDYKPNRHGWRKYVPRFLEKRKQSKLGHRLFLLWLFGVLFAFVGFPLLMCVVTGGVTLEKFATMFRMLTMAFYIGPLIGGVYSIILDENVKIPPLNKGESKLRFIDYAFYFGTATWYIGWAVQEWFGINWAIAILIQFIAFDLFIERNCKAQDAKEYAELCEDKFGITIRDKDNLKTVDEAKRLVTDIIANLNAR